MVLKLCKMTSLCDFQHRAGFLRWEKLTVAIEFWVTLLYTYLYQIGRPPAAVGGGQEISSGA